MMRLWFLVLLSASAGCIARGSFESGAAATPPPLSEKVAPGSVKGAVFALDDFEREGAVHGEDWSVFVDKNGLGTTGKFRRIAGGARTRGRAGQFSGFLGSALPPYAWSVITLNLSSGRKPTDLTAVRAVRFWVKGDGHRYRMLITKASSKDHADYQYVFDAPAQWTQVEVPVDLLAQPDWGEYMERRFDDALSIDFQPQTNEAPYELAIDDIELVLDPARTFPYKPVEYIEELPLDEILARKTTYTPIDIGRVANRGYEDQVAGDGKGGWTDQGENSVPGMPTGKQAFLGVPFQIPATPGKQVVVLRGRHDKALPTRVNVPVPGVRAPALYVLHAASWGAEDNGRYRVRYDNGQEVVIPIADKQQVFDFWRPEESPVARPAWLGRNPQKDPIGLTLFAWKNPHPGQPIVEIVAETSGDGAYLIVCGLTFGSDGPVLAKMPTIEFKGPRFFPYEGIAVEGRRGTALDMSRLLDAPAGKHGVLGRKGESFQFADGTKARFWGMNISDQGNFPTKEQAVWMADLCAQLGMNMTRHHLMDAHWSDHNIFGLKATDTQKLDPEWLDRFDYLVAQLQKRGIYQYLDLIIQRKPLASDGVQDADKVEPGYKMVGEFDEVLIKNQERYAEQLLRHRNPYTGKTYAEDPAVVMIDLTNESTLFFLGDWGQGELRSPYHRKLLQQLWNAWLQKKAGDRAALARRWAGGSGIALGDDEDPARGTVKPIFDFSDRTKEYLGFTKARVRDNVAFLADLELAYYRRMTGVVRGTGYRGLVTGTNHWVDQPMDEWVNATTDYLDRHAYWGHPFTLVYQYKANLTPIHGHAMLRDDDQAQALVPILAAKRVRGMPYIVTEWNNVHTLYRVEAPLLMASYGSLHGWSALQYSLTSQPLSESDQKDARLDSVFDLWPQATTLALWPATALLYHRGDVQEANDSAWRNMGDAEAHDPATRVKLPRGLAYVTKSGMNFARGKDEVPTDAPDALLAKHVRGKSATSTTGELVTDWGTGVFRVDTPRSQGAAGFLGGHPQALANLTVELANEYGAVIASSLDGQPLARARRILVTAVGNTVNTGFEVKKSGAVVRRGGEPPILIEALEGTVRLRGLDGATDALTVHALDASGRRTGSVAVTRDRSDVRFELSPAHKAMHYEVVR